MKIKIYLYDFVPREAFIFQQLGLKSLLELFLGRSFYHPKLSFPELSHSVNFEVVGQEIGSQNGVDLSSAFANFDRVVLWPLNQWSKDLSAAGSILEMALQVEATRIQIGNEYAFILTEPLVEDLPVFKLAIEASNLTAPSGEINHFAIATPHRYFNRFENAAGRIIKISSDKVKCASEAKFLTLVPQSVQDFFPPLIAFHESAQHFSYEIPRYEMLDLSRFLLHGSLNSDEWHQVFNVVEEYFRACPKKIVEVKDVRKVLREFFIDKLHRRHQEYQDKSPLKNLDGLVKELTNRLNDVIDKVTEQQLAFSHGDLCFSNMLLDRNNFEMKFIDARGAAEIHDAYLPLYYDFAKLSHCIHGRYDWIMAQNLVTPHQEKQHQILDAEFSRMLKAFDMDDELVSLGEASLFLSMLPLHLDQPHLHEAMIEAAKKAMSRHLRGSHGS